MSANLNPSQAGNQQISSFTAYRNLIAITDKSLTTLKKAKLGELLIAKKEIFDCLQYLGNHPTDLNSNQIQRLAIYETFQEKANGEEYAKYREMANGKENLESIDDTPERLTNTSLFVMSVLNKKIAATSPAEDENVSVIRQEKVDDFGYKIKKHKKNKE